MRRLIGLVLVAVMACAVAGCVTKSTTTDGDRGVLDQTRQAADVAIAKIEEGMLAAGVVSGGPASVAFGAALIAVRDVKANAEQQLKVHGPPKVSLKYTPENSKIERERSTKEHEGNTWFWPVIGAIAGIGATLMGCPWLVKLFPVLSGSVGRIAQAGLQTITIARQRAEANGGSLSIPELLGVAKEQNVLAGVQEIVADKAKKLEEKLGVDLKVDLAPKATPPTT